MLVLAGASLNFIALQLTHPHWLEALMEGVKLLSMDGSHSLLRSVNAARWEVQAAAPADPPVVVEPEGTFRIVCTNVYALAPITLQAEAPVTFPLI